MIYVKIHKSGLSKVVAVCDKELIEKRFFEGKLCLHIKKDFYKGKLVKEKDLKEIFKNAEILNIVGRRSISLALKEKIINKKNIIKIKGIPHAQLCSF